MKEIAQAFEIHYATVSQIGTIFGKWGPWTPGTP